MIEGLNNAEIKDWIVKLQWEIAVHKAIVINNDEIIDEMIILSQAKRTNHETLTADETEKLNKARAKANYHEKKRKEKKQLLTIIRQERANTIAVIRQN